MTFFFFEGVPNENALMNIIAFKQIDSLSCGQRIITDLYYICREMQTFSVQILSITDVIKGSLRILKADILTQTSSSKWSVSFPDWEL